MFLKPGAVLLRLLHETLPIPEVEKVAIALVDTAYPHGMLYGAPKLLGSRRYVAHIGDHSVGVGAVSAIQLLNAI